MEGRIDYGFVVTDVSSGGIVARLQKWTKEIAARGKRAAIIAVHDESSKLTVKVSAALFPFADFVSVKTDSLDRSDISAEKLIQQVNFRDIRCLVSSTFRYMFQVVFALRAQGWTGAYVEVVPANLPELIVAYRRNIAAADIVGCVSMDIAEKIRSSRLGADVIVVPGGAERVSISAPRVFKDGESRPLVICYAGRMDNRQKRVFDLPLIQRELIECGVSCSWLVAGRGADFDELVRRCLEVGPKDSFRFLGHVSPSEISKVYRHLISANPQCT